MPLPYPHAFPLMANKGLNPPQHFKGQPKSTSPMKFSQTTLIKKKNRFYFSHLEQSAAADELDNKLSLMTFLLLSGLVI